MPSVKSVFAFWEANLDSFAILPRAQKGGGGEAMRLIGSALKARVRRSPAAGLMASDKAMPRLTAPPGPVG
jgi:hypothetical protein